MPRSRKLQKTCPICGVSITDDAGYCRKHSNITRGNPDGYICPVCGGRKARIESKVCINCRDSQPYESRVNGWKRQGEELTADRDWLLQFVGLFVGEGSATMQKTNKGGVSARLTVALRSDDKAVLEDVHQKLGGVIYQDNHGKNPQTRWQISRTHDVLDACNLILDHAVLPAKKLREVKIVRDFCIWRLNQPFRCKDWAEAERMLFELRDMRVFKVQG